MALTPQMDGLSELQALPRNPKAHDLERIGESVERFGYLERIVVNDVTGRIVSGHGRVEALRKRKAAGDPPPENITVSGDDWLVPADHIEIPEEQEEAVSLALNRLVELGGWDETLLTSVLTELEKQDEMDGTGFDNEDLEVLLSESGWTGEGPDWSEIQEEIALEDYEPRHLPLGKLRANRYSPSAMSDKEFKALKNSMELCGVWQPLLVRPIEQGIYEIVDGLQRFRAAKEMGWDTLPVNIRKMTDAEAMVASVATSRLSGKLIPDRMAKVLSEARKARGDGFVGDAIGLPPVRMNQYKGAGSYGVEVDEDGVPERQYREYAMSELDPVGDFITLIVPFSAEDYEEVSGTLSEISTDWAAALLELVRRWEASDGSG